jgi:serine/tyrosine/threonine adenylyltransferase
MVSLTFDNSFAREMPADPRTDNRPRGVRGALYTKVAPTKVKAPSMLAWSREVAQMLDLGDDQQEPAAAEAWARVLSGNEPLPGMETIATRYGGHQFGHWAGQLGDGRAMTLGEVLSKNHGRLELQLKGAGMTPYSRRADGRAVLRSSLREFVCSEAMFHLGVPTTRALSLVTTGEPVMRDMFYDGNAEYEPGAVVCRVAPSFLRFGHFEVLASDNEIELLGKLLSYLLRQHYPHLASGTGSPDPDTLLAFLSEIAERTVTMVTHWQRVGFVHGVMNTDNMSALGLTIDYGPYGFLEPFDPHWTPNTTDAGGRRYRYGAQPNIALWNVARLAEALHPLLAQKLEEQPALDRLSECMAQAASRMQDSMRQMFAQKFGLSLTPSDDSFLAEGLGHLEATSADHTLFFRALCGVAEAPSDERLVAALGNVWYGEAPSVDVGMFPWLRGVLGRWAQDGRTCAERAQAMQAQNPAVVPRNWLAQEAIDAAHKGDAAPLHRLATRLQTPYADQAEDTYFAQKRPAWAEHKAGCSMLSCSS